MTPSTNERSRAGPGARRPDDGPAGGQDARTRRGSAALWMGVAAAPALWVVHDLASYIGASNVCIAGHDGARVLGLPATAAPILLLTILALPAAALITVRARRQRARGDFPETGAGAAPAERAGFLLALGVALGTLSVVGIAFSTIAAFTLRCGWT